MSNPNFLTANTSGIELMPGVNDSAVGYDVNRIIQALNGTNLVPITTGDLTVKGNETITGNLNVTGTITPTGAIIGPLTINPGPLTVTGSSAAGGLQLTSGNSGGGSTLSQLVFGWQGDSPAVHYPSFITTRHVGGAAAGNQMLFYTGDGTQAGVFPTNAILGLTIDSSTGVTTAKALTVASGGLIITAGGEVISGGDFSVNAGSIIAGGSANTTFINLSNLTNAAIRASGTNFGINNQANSATNLLISDAGLITLRNALKIPPSAGGTVAATSYGSVPVKIDEKTPSGVTNFTFSSIPSGFRHLQIFYHARGDSGSTNRVDMYVTINSDTGSNYVFQQLYGNNTSAQYSANATFTTPVTGGGAACGSLPAGLATANFASAGEILVVDYAGTTFLKNIFGRSTELDTLATTNSWIFGGRTILWNSTAAITSLTLTLASGNFVSGSVFTLYGIP